MNLSPIIVFDLDGTLVDSAPDLLDSLNFCLQKEGLTQYDPQDIRRLVGMGGRIMIERALTFQNIAITEDRIDKLLQNFLQHYENTMPGKTKFFDGVDACLDRLKDAGFELAVCTNKHEKLARHLLNGMEQIGRFSIITGGDSFSFRKPDPRHILKTIEFAQGDLNSAIMIGDSRADILAAQGADIPVIAVDFGYTDQPVQTFHPTKVISHFDELTVNLITECLN
ncbi:HAD family hydrolase [Bartonella tamiae]|uniref:Phosphoglycolate phosphatase n=1 Tax=Bartonella tamiae Th239 TaxID=1094558 RepID=J0ZQ43_9HYPH|nr:HAD family hydrolase [Bartonella tamiae]EJF90738.1 phosphoglycolate phosphatase, bacterial [Bartonella tamiae Th239]EJF93885.1 phosphoglycolate phosphatase, bacterial [Bartonella tamiae Th307]